MHYNDLLTKTVFLTKRNNISNSEIGKIINLDRQSINGRADRNSKFKPDEIEKIEKYFGINLTDISITNNSGAAINDETICLKTEDFGKRLYAILKINVPNIKN